jgi:hypothetical protein
MTTQKFSQAALKRKDSSVLGGVKATVGESMHLEFKCKNYPLLLYILAS